MRTLNCAVLGDMCEFLLEGEPVFVIRAQDKSSVKAVSDYIAASRQFGGTNLIRAEAHLARIVEWQTKNPDKVRSAT